jgi:hypothetical protein
MTRIAALALIGVAILVVLLLVVRTSGSPSPKTTSAPAAVTGCDNSYQRADSPIVPPHASGRFLRVALDRVVVVETQQRTRWAVRFFDPSNAPGSAEIPLRAQITDATGRPVTVYPEYEAGPPNSETGRVSLPITLTPCGAPRPAGSAGSTIVLIIQSAPITSGRYVVTLGPAKLPEGGTRGEVFDVTLTCDPRPGPAGGVCR